jgi:hypothetical protein
VFDLSFEKLRRIWPYALGAMPFIAIWCYLLIVYFPGHPKTPDPATGRTLELGFSHGQDSVYIAGWELAMMLGVFACAAVIIGIGLFRTLRGAWRG